MRMHVRKSVRLLLGAFCVAGSLGGCKCGREAAAPDETSIDQPAIIEQHPNAPHPEIHFPHELKTEDHSLNQFVMRILEICYKGDYDGFRQLFGTKYTPTSKTNFESVWMRVGTIRVVRIERHPRKEPIECYLHAKIELREPDRQDRTERNVVIMIFQEDGEWRLGTAPREATKAILAADSQPADNN
ncbi:MAG: hypothetical protein GXY44_07490 [Phycisphaerales bacterium]|nr:hypothetical protein [Phycisphaerales bacterium]